MTNKTDSRSRGRMTSMAVRGKNYREDYEFELYGKEVTAILRPLIDDEFFPIAAFLAEHFDLDDEVEQEEAVSEAIDQVDEAKEEADDDQLDMSKIDKEFVAIMQEAAILGVEGEYDEDGEEIALSEEEAEEFVTSLMGGYSVELGAQVLEVSGDVRDAEKFRGARGSISDSGNS